jgi:hypothetical protein
MKQSNLVQFKKNLDSIQYSDVVALRERKEKHALKLEDLEISLKIADQYVEVMRDFLQDDLSFNKDRVESFECRRRDGYFPYSYNKGGLEGICYRDQLSAYQNTGFENTDSVLSKYADYNLEAYCKDNQLDMQTYADWTDEQREAWYEVEQEYFGDDTIQFQARIMMTSETTANVDFYVSASDSPYHRSSDDKLEVEISFKSPAGMKRQLKKLLKNKFVARLERNVREGW